MKAALFCANPYAFGVLEPLWNELTKQGHETLWYVPVKLMSSFPFANTTTTNSVKELNDFKSDVLFVPGNEVPYYLRGVKVQVFHGLAGEKRGHFRIRHYFDLYLTQGPYFTRGFEALRKKYDAMEVKQTGWCKLDSLFANHEVYQRQREDLLREFNKERIVLYAPTFSPRLTSTELVFQQILEIAQQPDILLLIKFHDLMDKGIIARYVEAASQRSNITLIEDRNIIKTMVMADLMISDTSSVVYEFLLLNKPVVTIRSTSENVAWCDVTDPTKLPLHVAEELKSDNYKDARQRIIDLYHPYSDGRSSARMIEAVKDYMERHGVPEKRKLSLFRRWKIHRQFGRAPGNH